MKSPDHELSFSNPGPGPLYVWLEPWADEFEVPALSTITLTPSREVESCPLGELEWTADHLVIWASAQKVIVSIDGVAQRSGSAIIPIPDSLNRENLSILFAGQPTARLAGADSLVTEKARWWKRLKRSVGL